MAYYEGFCSGNAFVPQCVTGSIVNNKVYRYEGKKGKDIFVPLSLNDDYLFTAQDGSIKVRKKMRNIKVYF